MEIKASSSLDESTLKEFNTVYFFKEKPKSEILKFTVGLTASTLINAVISVALSEHALITCLSYFMRFSALAFLLGLALSLFSLFVANRAYSKAGKMKDAKNEYVFTDSEIREFSYGEGLESKTLITYTDIIKVTETHRFFFLFITKQAAYIIDKQTIEGGTAEELKMKLLAYCPKKYEVRNF